MEGWGLEEQQVAGKRVLSVGHPGSEIMEAIQGRCAGAAGHTGLKLGEKLQLEVGGSAHERYGMEFGNGVQGDEGYAVGWGGGPCGDRSQRRDTEREERGSGAGPRSRMPKKETVIGQERRWILPQPLAPLEGCGGENLPVTSVPQGPSRPPGNCLTLRTGASSGLRPSYLGKIKSARVKARGHLWLVGREVSQLVGRASVVDVHTAEACTIVSLKVLQGGPNGHVCELILTDIPHCCHGKAKSGIS